MSSDPEKEWRDFLPKTNYFDKSIELVVGFDRLLVTIYSALIAGIVVMLLKEEVSFWVGSMLLLALVCFVMGIGHTLLHINFMSKMLLLAEVLVNGTELVPNAVEEEEPTARAYARNQAYAQRSYSSQLIYLLIGVTFGAVAVVVKLWEYAWRAGVIGLLVLILLIIVVSLLMTWKRIWRKYHPSLTANRES